MSTPGHPTPPPPAHRRRPTLTITAGPVSSGKSDWVRSFRNNKTAPLCIIRDEIRTLIGGENYLHSPVDPQIEEVVTDVIEQQTKEALAQDKDVYVDGCHNHPLTRRQWETLATESGASFQLMLFSRTLEEITALNAQRPTPHAQEKIETSFHQWENQFQQMPPRPHHQYINQERSRAWLSQAAS